MDAYNISLFLSANEGDVRAAIQRNAPAGHVQPTSALVTDRTGELRVAFDFDGVIGDDASEAVYKLKGLQAFHEHEERHGHQAINPGPFSRFFRELSKLQAREHKMRDANPTHVPRIRTAIVTARNAPAHKRVITTLRDWGVIEVDEVHFLGGIDKALILKEFRPHIFFDDQISHVESVSRVAPSVHVPFGISNVEVSEADLNAALVEDSSRSRRAQPPSELSIRKVA